MEENEIYFTYDNIMEMTVVDVYIHNFPSILSIHLFSIIVTFDIVFFFWECGVISIYF